MTENQGKATRSGTSEPERRPSLVNRIVLALLRSPLSPLLGSGLVALQYNTSQDRRVTLPVGSVPTPNGLVVLVGRSNTKRWWRHFRSCRPIRVWISGEWRPTTANIAWPGSVEYRQAMDAWRRRRPRSRVSGGDPVVLITAPPMPPRAAFDGARLWRSWTGWATLGEFVGFGVPASTAAMVATWSVAAAMPLLVMAGAAEGAMLGLAQAHVLRRVLPALNGTRWVAATAAAVAWAIGLLPMVTEGRLFDLALVVVIPAAAVLGAVLLASIGTAQWLVLRHHVHRSGMWITTTAAAWTAGLLVFTAVTTPLWQPDQPAPMTAAIGLLGGLMMAATVAAITGWALVRLLREPVGTPVK